MEADLYERRDPKYPHSPAQVPKLHFCNLKWSSTRKLLEGPRSVLYHSVLQEFRASAGSQRSRWGIEIGHMSILCSCEAFNTDQQHSTMNTYTWATRSFFGNSLHAIPGIVRSEAGPRARQCRTHQQGHPKAESLPLGIQIAQSREYLHILGPKVGFSYYVFGSQGYSSQPV